MAEYTVNIANAKEGNTVLISYSGNLTIQHIQKIKQDTFFDYSKFKEVEIKVDNPEDLDQSFLQLMLVLKKHLNDEYQMITSFNWQLSDSLYELLIETGFDDLFIK